MPNSIESYVYHTLADTSKAEKIMGFMAKLSLEDGARLLAKYYNSFSRRLL